MKYQASGRSALLPISLFAAVVLFGNPATADVLHFRVAFENVPGAAEIEAGNLAAGIKVIEEQAAPGRICKSWRHAGDALRRIHNQ